MPGFSGKKGICSYSHTNIFHVGKEGFGGSTFFHKIFQTTEEVVVFLNFLYEVSVSLIPKPDKGITRIIKINVNMYAQFLNKVLTHLIQQHEKEKENIQNYELKFIPKMQSWFNIPKLINVIHYIHREKKNKK